MKVKSDLRSDPDRIVQKGIYDRWMKKNTKKENKKITKKFTTKEQ